MKIGFAGKFLPSDSDLGLKKSEDYWKYNTKTVRFTDNRSVLEGKLWNVISHNLLAIENIMLKVATFPENLRMVRLSSDILPFFSHPLVKDYYKDSIVSNVISTQLGIIGRIAKDNNIKVSFHPGQFCCLASTSNSHQ